SPPRRGDRPARGKAGDVGGIAMRAVRPLAAMAGDLERARRGGAFGPRERAAAARIVAAVRRGGDSAVLRVVRQFDSVEATVRDLLADRAMLRRAGRAAPREVRAALDLAHDRIHALHTAQRPPVAARREPAPD